MTEPILTTARLILRPPKPQDLPACVRFWASDRSHLMGGPWDAERTAEEFGALLAQWDRRGFGLFVITLQGSDEGIGDTGPYFPPERPEPELGWTLWDGAHEGKGIAFEAAVAARDWFFTATPHRTAVSYTDPANHRSHRVLERMGAVAEPGSPHPFGARPTLVWRHTAGAA